MGAPQQSGKTNVKSLCKIEETAHLYNQTFEDELPSFGASCTENSGYVVWLGRMTVYPSDPANWSETEHSAGMT